jgi:hypothetical protein
MNLQTYIATFISFLNGIVIPFMLGMAFLVFVINVFRFFILGGANPDSQEKAKQLAVYGVGAFVFIVIFWGVVNLVNSSFGIARFGEINSQCFDYNPNCNDKDTAKIITTDTTQKTNPHPPLFETDTTKQPPQTDPITPDVFEITSDDEILPTPVRMYGAERTQEAVAEYNEAVRQIQDFLILRIQEADAAGDQGTVGAIGNLRIHIGTSSTLADRNSTARLVRSGALPEDIANEFIAVVNKNTVIMDCIYGQVCVPIDDNSLPEGQPR